MSNDRDLDDLHPDLLPLAKQWIANCEAAGMRVGISETYRSNAEQDADYAVGRTKPGKVITNARGGQSPHNFTLDDGTPAAKAFDFFILDKNGQCDWNAGDKQWQKAISIGEELGLVSGSTFRIKDNDHLEMANWSGC